MVEGVDTMLKVAKEVLADQTMRQVNRLLLQEEADATGTVRLSMAMATVPDTR